MYEETYGIEFGRETMVLLAFIYLTLFTTTYCSSLSKTNVSKDGKGDSSRSGPSKSFDLQLDPINNSSRHKRQPWFTQQQHIVFHYRKREGYWGPFYVDTQTKFWVRGGYLEDTGGKNRVNKYIMRVYYNGTVQLGEWQGEKGLCFFILDRTGTVIQCNDIPHEVLYTEEYYVWEERRQGDIIDGAVVGGITRNYEITYVCRIFYVSVDLKRQGIIVGAIATSWKGCVANYDGEMHWEDVYDVLKDNRYAKSNPWP